MAAKTVSGLSFWTTYGYLAPTLAKLANLVLSTASTTCAAERNWNDYDYIHNDRRNRLTAPRYFLEVTT